MGLGDRNFKNYCYQWWQYRPICDQVLGQIVEMSATSAGTGVLVTQGYLGHQRESTTTKKEIFLCCSKQAKMHFYNNQMDGAAGRPGLWQPWRARAGVKQGLLFKWLCPDSMKELWAAVLFEHRVTAYICWCQDWIKIMSILCAIMQNRC